MACEARAASVSVRGMNAVPTPPKSLLRAVGKAIADFGMIREGDRVLLGLSGGKDSLSLLHLLLHLRQCAPVKFELGAATVDPMTEGLDQRPLIPYLEGLGVPYFQIAEPIMERAKTHMGNDSICAFCSRMKRGILYRIAREQGYGTLALAHHLDDLAETFLMSVFHGGQLRTMKPNYLNDAGDVRVIRPLCYARERQTRVFAQAARLPVIGDNCPACFRMPTERMRFKQMLAQEEAGNTRLFKSLLAAMRPLMA